ncbi:MAG: aminotransferase class I/II-fold pyridoxal phosphate-dependent enzyme [Chloroflexi bacterium]|nr:aminotransferase class I/II-fold pyridoxal phosphate-dependent enzyme [Chloroflexota bacterium]
MSVEARGIRPANRIANLPPYLFAEVDRRIAEKRAAGFDVISLGIGDPDLPSPDHVVAAAQEAVADPRRHRYPDYYGLPEFRKAIARWYENRFEITLDPDKEVVPLIGSKEGIAHIPLAFVDPGDVVLVPDPGYPVYSIGTLLANGEPYLMPLRADSGFLPDLDTIPEAVADRARILWINYPNNPTAAIAPIEFFERVVSYARRHDILVCHDNAYSDVAYDGYRAPSFLEVPGAIDVGVEFHSLSKTYNMTGWRSGMMVGNRTAVEALGRVKTNVDSGIFDAVQIASIAALDGDPHWIEERNRRFQTRRDAIVATLKKIGIDVSAPKASLYIWAPVPAGMKSVDFSLRVLDDAAVWVTPGVGFGANGEGYFRISLTVADHRLSEALERIEKLNL